MLRTYAAMSCCTCWPESTLVTLASKGNCPATHPVHDANICVALSQPVVVDGELCQEAGPMQARLWVATVTRLVSPSYHLHQLHQGSSQGGRLGRHGMYRSKFVDSVEVQV